MFENLKAFFTPKSDHLNLADLLSSVPMQEDLLGVKPVVMPTTEKIKTDTNRLIAYSHSEDYQMFAKELWARVLASLDVIQDEKATAEKIQYHRAVLKTNLDALRVSYQAREMLKLQHNNVPAHR